jgi:hypothetical protein
MDIELDGDASALDAINMSSSWPILVGQSLTTGLSRSGPRIGVENV